MAIENLTVVSPDAGGVERARAFAKRLKAPLAIIDKRREAMNVAEVMNIIGRVKNRNCLIVDDLIDTAGTLVKGAQGAAGPRSGQRIGLRHARGPVRTGRRAHCGVADQGSGFHEFDPAVRSRLAGRKKIRSLSVAPLLARAIQSIHEETSVSTLFV